MRKNRILAIGALAALAICSSSCQKDNGQGLFGHKGEIRIQTGTSATKASTMVSPSAEQLLMNMPFVTETGDTLCLMVTVSDMPEAMMPEGQLTKGAVITTDNLAEKYESFKTTIYKGGSLYTDDQGKSVNGKEVGIYEGEWTIDGAPYHWPHTKSDVIDFCSYAPISGAGVSNIAWSLGETKTVSFDYANTPAGLVEGAYHDAENQKDIIFAINSRCENDNNGIADIVFSHALVGVQFIKGDIQDCYLNTVTLKNFYSKGKSVGTLTPKTGKEDYLSFAWSDQDVPKDYSQSFTGAKNVNTIADKGSLDPTEDASYTFMMVPQELDSEATVEIVLHYGGASYQTLSVNLGSITDAEAGEGNAALLKDWSAYAGKIIRIRINRADIAVAVDEEFSDAIKSNVGAKNTGGKIEFVRMSVEANWVDEDLNIHETCDFRSDAANLVDYLASGCNWKYNAADGFYYYSKAIVPGAVTQGKIFGSYTTPDAPEEGLHLEMSVIVQGVEYDKDCAKAKAAWGIGDGYLTSEIEVEAAK